jgi:hypothetical protein
MARMGRPRLRPEQKVIKVGVAFYPADLELVKEWAKAPMGTLTVSQVLRWLVKEEAKRRGGK